MGLIKCFWKKVRSVIFFLLCPVMSLLYLIWNFLTYCCEVMGQCISACKSSQDRGGDNNDENTMKRAEEKRCSSCELRESFQKDFNIILNENGKLNDEKERQKEQIRTLQTELQRVRQSSDNLTKQMAERLESRNIFEDVSNPMNCSKLTQRFKRIYDKEFFSVSEALEEVMNTGEIEVIKLLTEVMEITYRRCCEKAETQIRRFLFLDENEDIPSREEKPSLYKMRCEVSVEDGKREKVVKEVLEDLDWELITAKYDPKSEIKTLLLNFLHQFAECSWLMTIADPPLMLNFDVVDKLYEGTRAKHFTIYATQEPIKAPFNTIVGVVWPSVTSENGQDFYAKGEVLVNTHVHTVKTASCYGEEDGSMKDVSSSPGGQDFSSSLDDDKADEKGETKMKEYRNDHDGDQSDDDDYSSTEID